MFRPVASRKSLRVVMATTPLWSIFSTTRGTALALVELGSVAFFAPGIAHELSGTFAPLFLLGAVVLGFALRAADLESCALFIPGGPYGAAKDSLGRKAARVAAAALLVQYLLVGALAAAACGHYLGSFLRLILGAQPFGRDLAAQDSSTALALGIVGLAWWWQREGRSLSTQLVTRTVVTAAALLGLVIVWGVVSVVLRDGVRAIGASWQLAALPGVASAPTAWSHALRAMATIAAGLGFCLFAAGGTDVLGHVAPEFPQPKIRHLRRTAGLGSLFVLPGILGIALLFPALIPLDVQEGWRNAPAAALAFNVAAPAPLRFLLLAGVALAASLFLFQALLRSTIGAEQLVSRLAEDGVLVESIRQPHPKLGTPSRLIGLTMACELAALLVSSAHLSWLAKACSIGIAVSALLQLGTLARLRVRRPEARAFRLPLNPRFGGRERPVGLLLAGLGIGIPAAALLATGDPAALAGAALVLMLTGLFAASEQRAASGANTPAPELELATTPTIGLEQVPVRPGNLLVAVRRPHFLAHLSAALQAAGDRDVVVMTARIVGVDVADDLAIDVEPTQNEYRVLAAAAALSERYGRGVRLVIVPATNAFDAVAETVLRLRSSEVYVGESETLSADDQARLLGEAWERAPKTEPFDVRLAIYHSSGRTAAYHLGAHAPTLSSDDLDLIHRLWLDAVKAVGPRIHHHDIVRAALKHMEEQFNSQGPPRDAALDLVRQVAHPADELAAVVRRRDFAGLRDMVRNRPASDLAGTLTDLPLEDQAVAFRVLPRKVAAATFEYLSQEAQEALMKAMAQEDVAALLNNMAPDDRTMFLEELPASVTQQMLALLRPEERAIAVTLLGYPEDSIGRLMTPDYLAVREHWTVQDVLDYVRTHGHDSETLNVIYVVDDHGVLTDDIGIRDFLLASPTSKVADLMDRRFIALKAGDDQSTAVAAFRESDHAALPVTDSAGVLIGIITIDDVLDVAEAAATEEIQRIGGSEALDEPYMRIAFTRMIQKRAGWLTALFLGEMLTATAMAAFEQEIERAVVLALFVPLIISSGGNSGSQASTLVIRAIALGEVQLKDWWRVMRRETAAGLALGSILGTIGFLRITVWSAFSSLYGQHWLLVALTVATALVGVVLWGTLVGSLLPFLLRRLGFDPATSSAPFVATLVDVTGLVIYFSIGLVILRGTLL